MQQLVTTDISTPPALAPNFDMLNYISSRQERVGKLYVGVILFIHDCSTTFSFSQSVLFSSRLINFVETRQEVSDSSTGEDGHTSKEQPSSVSSDQKLNNENYSDAPEQTAAAQQTVTAIVLV